MAIRKRELRSALDEVLKACESSKMNHANFNSLWDKDITLPTKDTTSFIKNHTRLFRETWITSRLEKAIAIITAELDR